MEYLHCPTCPGSRRKAHDLVCGECYRRWTEEAATALAGGSYVSLLGWASAAVTDLLPALESQRQEAQAGLNRLNETIHAEVVAALQKAAKGATIDRTVWAKAYSDRKQALWAQRNGNALYARVKTLEGRIAFGRHILADAAAHAVAKQTADEAATDEVATAEAPAPTRPRKVRGGRASERHAVRDLVNDDPAVDDEDGEDA
ncbi:MAG: hypothetical protein HYT21_01605 [Candidatus Nealsonbacteria bacterium]|nr:hypothetical protein [Candidatus Nealsonbacteria bacterium]